MVLKKPFQTLIQVINSIFVTRVTEPIPIGSDTFPTKQNINDSSLFFAERRLFKSLLHLDPAQSRSLPQFYGEILLVNYFTKLWREVINGLRKLAVVCSTNHSLLWHFLFHVRGYIRKHICLTPWHIRAGTASPYPACFALCAWWFKRGIYTGVLLIEIVLSGLNLITCLCYLDDVIIHSKDLNQHCKRWAEVLSRFRQHNLCVKIFKCTFAAPKVSYLGHVISCGRVSPDPTKVEAVQNLSSPISFKDVRSFIGAAGYYRRFVPGFASVAVPLTDLTRQDFSDVAYQCGIRSEILSVWQRIYSPDRCLRCGSWRGTFTNRWRWGRKASSFH